MGLAVSLVSLSSLHPIKDVGQRCKVVIIHFTRICSIFVGSDKERTSTMNARNWQLLRPTALLQFLPSYPLLLFARSWWFSRRIRYRECRWRIRWSGGGGGGGGRNESLESLLSRGEGGGGSWGECSSSPVLSKAAFAFFGKTACSFIFICVPRIDSSLPSLLYAIQGAGASEETARPG